MSSLLNSGYIFLARSDVCILSASDQETCQFILLLMILILISGGYGSSFGVFLKYNHTSGGSRGDISGCLEISLSQKEYPGHQ